MTKCCCRMTEEDLVASMSLEPTGINEEHQNATTTILGGTSNNGTLPMVVPFFCVTRLILVIIIVAGAPSLSPTLNQSLCPAPSSRIIGDTRSLGSSRHQRPAVQCVSAGNRLSCRIASLASLEPRFSISLLAWSLQEAGTRQSDGGKKSNAVLFSQPLAFRHASKIIGRTGILN